MRTKQAKNLGGLGAVVGAALLAGWGCGGGGGVGEAEAPKDPYTAAYENCMRYGGSNPMICETVARTQAGPQQKTNTEAQWAELEKAAADKLQGAGATEISPPARLQNVGFMVEHAFEVESGKCYDASIAWSSGWKTSGAVMFVAPAGGKPVNENLGGKNIQIDAPGGVIHFCADNPGSAKLTLSGVGSNGAILNNERLEYVVAVGAQKEAPAQAAERRKAEAVQAEDGRARVETNLQMADSRRGGERLASGCARCRKLFRTCVDESKAEDKTVDAQRATAERCNLSFETCAQGLGLDERGRILCSGP